MMGLKLCLLMVLVCVASLGRAQNTDPSDEVGDYMTVVYYDPGFQCVALSGRYEGNVVAAASWTIDFPNEKCFDSGPLGFPFPNSYVAVDKTVSSQGNSASNIACATASINITGVPVYNGVVQSFCFHVVQYNSNDCSEVAREVMVPFGCNPGGVFVNKYNYKDAEALVTISTANVIQQREDFEYLAMYTGDCIDTPQGTSMQVATCTQQDEFSSAALLLQYREHSCSVYNYDTAIALESSPAVPLACQWSVLQVIKRIKSLPIPTIIGITFAVTFVGCMMLTGVCFYCYLLYKRLCVRDKFSPDEVESLIEIPEIGNRKE
jgi:hypothetical protein